jgi:hypothetical protein
LNNNDQNAHLWCIPLSGALPEHDIQVNNGGKEE